MVLGKRRPRLAGAVENEGSIWLRSGSGGVADILSKLKSLENETDPTAGNDATAADKGVKAQQALGLAWKPRRHRGWVGDRPLCRAC